MIQITYYIIKILLLNFFFVKVHLKLLLLNLFNARSIWINTEASTSGKKEKKIMELEAEVKVVATWDALRSHHP
jgi:hypothetical protein